MDGKFHTFTLHFSNSCGVYQSEIAILVHQTMTEICLNHVVANAREKILAFTVFNTVSQTTQFLRKKIHWPSDVLIGGTSPK